MNKRVALEDMDRALKHLDKRNPAGYAQLLMLPFSFVPDHAWDDRNDPWWSSEEAASKLQQVKDAAHDGPKPGGPTHMSPRYPTPEESAATDKANKAYHDRMSYWRHDESSSPQRIVDRLLG